MLSHAIAGRRPANGAPHHDSRLILGHLDHIVRRSFNNYTEKNGGKDAEAVELSTLNEFTIRKWIWDRSVAP
jgi:hypothetical protein